MRERLGIGVVGAGLIVEHAHLPAYKSAGLTVRGVYDQDRARADRLAAEFGVQAYRSLDQLVEDEGVDIVDCAVTPDAQEQLVPQFLNAGKHVLCQKPLADSLEVAQDLVERADRRGLKLAVNQQMRWEPTIQEMKRRLIDGRVGEPVLLSYRLNFMGEYPGPHWLNDLDRLFARFGTIHYIDSARYLLGEPSRVTARLLRDKVQHASGETFINAWLEWPNGATMVAFERYTCKTGDIECDIRLEGTRGAVTGRLGIYLDYPSPHADVIKAIQYDDPGWTLVSTTQTWLPGAFAKPMQSLIDAIQTNGEPATSGHDNLRTLRLVEALYESDRLGRTVDLDAKE